MKDTTTKSLFSHPGKIRPGRQEGGAHTCVSEIRTVSKHILIHHKKVSRVLHTSPVVYGLHVSQIDILSLDILEDCSHSDKMFSKEHMPRKGISTNEPKMTLAWGLRNELCF